jgi:hypothetical protein
VTVFWSSFAGGFLGTLVMTTMLRGAAEMGLTRMDLPFLLGTAVTANRRKAKAIGYLFHFLLGIGFALLYGALFAIIGRGSWWLGALVGLVQSLFTATVLVNVLLPVVHPRMATSDTAANDIALIEPPGFLMLNYGHNTFLINLLAHVAYGAIVGGVVRI